MYRLMRDRNVVSKLDIFKLIISYLSATLIYLAIPYFNKLLIDFANSPSNNVSTTMIILIIAGTFLYKPLYSILVIILLQNIAIKLTKTSRCFCLNHN